jgi:ribonucleoside-diphosphate reductase alpha chain
MSSSEYVWYNDLSAQFLGSGYLLPNQSLDEKVSLICNRTEQISGIVGVGDRLKTAIKKGWISPSTPIWSNYGEVRGLPISCFGSTVGEDNLESILYANSEVAMMSKHGGGTSMYLTPLRSRGTPISAGGHSSGSVHFAEMFDKTISLVSQNGIRRGNMAAYLDIDHPDIMEFLHIKHEGHPIQDLSTGVCVTNSWLDSMKAGDVEKRKIWAKVIESRFNTGYPYLFFADNANGSTKPKCYKKTPILHSNLCNEISLPTTVDESFVCCLASLNVARYNEWEHTDVVELVTILLDSVMTEFIEKASTIPYMERAVKFARRHRALGIGILGYHSYLQSQMIAFESMEAKIVNVQIIKNIRSKAYAASEMLAELLGKPEVLANDNRRNTTLLAIAPTKSSAFILGQVSEGIEPHRSNYFIKDLAKGKFSIRNPHLEILLEQRGLNTEETWQSILRNQGSVQHLEGLSADEKSVFKTFQEISPMEIIIQAGQRQKYIDQGQSLNLMIHPQTPIKQVNELILTAVELGIKGLYYQIGINAAQEFRNNVLACTSCEG